MEELFLQSDRGWSILANLGFVSSLGQPLGPIVGAAFKNKRTNKSGLYNFPFLLHFSPKSLDLSFSIVLDFSEEDV